METVWVFFRESLRITPEDAESSRGRESLAAAPLAPHDTCNLKGFACPARTRAIPVDMPAGIYDHLPIRKTSAQSSSPQEEP
jgi:hypothetical protein